MNAASFFLADPVSARELEKVIPVVTENVKRAISVIQQRVTSPLSCSNKDDDDATMTEASGERDQEELKEPEYKVRDYQSKSVERALKQNTIVHLGTGMGKTLIAILLLKHYQGKKAVFLTPNVALCQQQAKTLRKHFPKSDIRTVCGQFSTDREILKDADILVATHGAYLDLLTHYGDMFQLSNVAVLVIDECHHCSGQSAYASIMQLYHETTRGERPRVLGLTASPFLHVRNTDQLDQKIEVLERLLDAKLYSPPVPAPEAAEYRVSYEPTPPPLSFPSVTDAILPCRHAELGQFESMYVDLGSIMTSVYCREMKRQLRLNAFEGETLVQLDAALQFLQEVVDYCEAKLFTSDKLLQLKMLLQQELVDGKVGVVFCQRRSTAFAIAEYFRRWSKKKEDHDDEKSDGTVMGEAGGGDVSDDADMHEVENERSIHPMCVEGQFDDVDDESSGGVFSDAMDDPLVTGDKHVGEGGNSSVQQSYQSSWKYPTPTVPNEMNEEESLTSFEGRWDDAPDDPMIGDATALGTDDMGAAEGDPSLCAEATTETAIRCAVLVGRESNIFNSSNVSSSFTSTGRDDNLVLGEGKDRKEVLEHFRNGKVNVLIATSVIEEGVDVPACSFVASFDPLLSTKSYVQMRGRARHRDAKFFVFDHPEDSENAFLDLKRKEGRIQEYLRMRSESNLEEREEETTEQRPPLINGLPRGLFPMSGLNYADSSPELVALRVGEYRADHGIVRLNTAKSVLNKFVLAQPIDPTSRSTRESLRPYMPDYTNGTKLFLPAHISDSVSRVVELPVEYLERNKSERESSLALMACVRLHQYGLLSSRLLPLTNENIQQKLESLIADATDEKFDSIPFSIDTRDVASASSDLFVYRLVQEGHGLQEYRQMLNAGEIDLAIVTSFDLGSIPCLVLNHADFGMISCHLASAQRIPCSREQRALLSDFFVLVWNARWKRKTRTYAFRMSGSKDDRNDDSYRVLPYSVACTDRTGSIRWEYMRRLVKESIRSEESRKRSVVVLSDNEKLREPRLWFPKYNPHVLYIALGPSTETVDACFPHDCDNEEVKTYADYFRLEKGCEVPPGTRLFDVQHMWHLPSNQSSKLSSESTGRSLSTRTARLPKTVCIEPPMADAGLFLLSTFLPAFLFHMERFETARAFTRTYGSHMASLGSVFEKAPLTDVVSALSAKSCRDRLSYERLEWLGDGVLKLVHSDVIMKSTSLRAWIRNMHEGHLDAIRSTLGRNNRLESICKSLGMHRFILVDSLSRGSWTPAPMERFSTIDEVIENDDASPSEEESSRDGKTCADVVEALIGLAFVHGSYELAMAVCGEIKVTIPWENSPRDGPMLPKDDMLVAACESITGYRFTSHYQLLVEAFTHPSCGNPITASYQQLEWIGDAVLCLAARNWIYHNFPEMAVGDMVLMEAALVSNQSLAYLSLRSGLYKNIFHEDPVLNQRISSYADAVLNHGRGLWGTEPPKAIADVVESLVGAVHVHGGFACGQEAATSVLKPILGLLETQKDPEVTSPDKTTTIELLLRHPKRSLLELGGKTINISSKNESSAAKDNQEGLVWTGASWERPHVGGIGLVGTVTVADVPIISVLDESSTSASNRASFFVLSAFEQNEELLESFKQSCKELMRAESRATEETMASEWDE